MLQENTIDLSLIKTKIFQFLFKVLFFLGGDVPQVISPYNKKFLSQEIDKEIHNLVSRLAQLKNVVKVRAVRSKNDSQEITFQILSYADFDDTKKLAEAATALVVETEWKICDISKDENWDFGTQILSEFGSSIEDTQIVSCNNA